MDSAPEITLFDTTFELWIFSSPLGIATAVGIVLVLLMAAVAFTLPRLYQQWFVRVLGFAFALVAGGSAYCWGVSAGIIEAFDISRDLNVALTIHDMAHEWRLKSLWFSLGFLVFCVLHFAFAYLARWSWLRRIRKQEVLLNTTEQQASTEVT